MLPQATPTTNHDIVAQCHIKQFRLVLRYARLLEKETYLTNLFHLRETRSTKLAAIKALGDNPDTAAFTALETEIRSLDGQIKNAATIAEFERHEAAPADNGMARELRSYSIGKSEIFHGETVVASRAFPRFSESAWIPKSALL